jgi:hypothetical protein
MRKEAKKVDHRFDPNLGESKKRFSSSPFKVSDDGR